MKKSIKLMSALALLTLFIPSANAGLLDLRVGAGLDAANPKDFEDRVHAVNGDNLEAESFDTYNADLIFHLPVIPVTVGVRYEQASQDQSGNSTDWDLDVNNLALIANLRLINSKIYLGPIISVGYPWGKLDFSDGSTREEHHLDSKQVSYSGGLEAGIYLGPFLIGAEAGYRSLQLKHSGSTSSSSVNADVNLDGFYGKALVGLTFL